MERVALADKILGLLPEGFARILELIQFIGLECADDVES
ncbi:MAG: hypothetical protein QOI96_1901 [Verrucomicrobiota bacterium]